MTRREYAISLGLAQPGRGRLSRDAHAAIVKAESEGMVFDDKPTVRVERTSRPVASKQEAGIPTERPLRYPLDSVFKGTDSNGKTHKVSGRNACMNCGYSLVGHICNTPVTIISTGRNSLESISVEVVS